MAMQERNWAATATAVRWWSRASLERRRTNEEHTAKAIRRIRVTTAKPRLGTGCCSPEALRCWGRWRQAWRKPCFKAQCRVRSIQPLFSFFQRSCPKRRTTGAAKVEPKVVIQTHSWEVVSVCF